MILVHPVAEQCGCHGGIHHLRRLPGVREAVAVAADGSLVAFLVGDKQPVPVLVRELARVFPRYMIPRRYRYVDRLPLNANGKLDRKALPAPEYAASAASGAPATAREQALCEVFAQVLGLEEVGLEDSFFDLGGHSLLAAVLVARLAQRFGVKISLRTFMSNSSVRAIDQHLSSQDA